MKEMFRGFYRLSDEEYATLLGNCLFVLDASFLCSLYRFPETARTELISALSRVSSRLWIPYQAALEFQRNRLNVIVDQKSKFSAVRDILDKTRKTFKTDLSKLQLKKRHSLIDPESMENGIDALFDSFEKKLSEYESELQDIIDPDPLQEELDKLLATKIGSPPNGQQEIDSIYTEGKTRYAKKIPPGYMDFVKANDKESNEYTYGGIIYERQYGDLLIWKQLLSEAQARGLKSVVFLTDDVKEDWWWMIGEKKVGPRPELRDEIFRVAGVTQFHIYNSEQFLRVAGKHLGAKVSEATIQTAKDLLETLRREAHLRRLRAEASPEEIVEEILPDFASDLINSDEQITGTTAVTNAFGYGLDEYEILSVEYNESKQQIEFEARIEISGDHDQDKPYCGDAISVRVSGVIRYSRNGWVVQHYEIESCELNC